MTNGPCFIQLVYYTIFFSICQGVLKSFFIFFTFGLKLQENAGFIRHELSQVMRMRTVPALTFRMDGSMVYGAKMDELFKKITYTTPAEPTDED